MVGETGQDRVWFANHIGAVEAGKLPHFLDPYEEIIVKFAEGTEANNRLVNTWSWKRIDDNPNSYQIVAFAFPDKKREQEFLKTEHGKRLVIVQEPKSKESKVKEVPDGWGDWRA